MASVMSNTDIVSNILKFDTLFSKLTVMSVVSKCFYKAVQTHNAWRDQSVSTNMTALPHIMNGPAGAVIEDISVNVRKLCASMVFTPNTMYLPATCVLHTVHFEWTYDNDGQHRYSAAIARRWFNFISFLLCLPTLKCVSLTDFTFSCAVDAYRTPVDKYTQLQEIYMKGVFLSTELVYMFKASATTLTKLTVRSCFESMLDNNNKPGIVSMFTTADSCLRELTLHHATTKSILECAQFTSTLQYLSFHTTIDNELFSSAYEPVLVALINILQRSVNVDASFRFHPIQNIWSAAFSTGIIKQLRCKDDNFTSSLVVLSGVETLILECNKTRMIGTYLLQLLCYEHLKVVIVVTSATVRLALHVRKREGQTQLDEINTKFKQANKRLFVVPDSDMMAYSYAKAAEIMHTMQTQTPDVHDFYTRTEEPPAYYM